MVVWEFDCGLTVKNRILLVVVHDGLGCGRFKFFFFFFLIRYYFHLSFNYNFLVFFFFFDFPIIEGRPRYFLCRESCIGPRILRIPSLVEEH